MTWPPIDSTEAAEFREREAEAESPVPHSVACRGGWLGEDAEGRPIPCLMCRPHLAARQGRVDAKRDLLAELTAPEPRGHRAPADVATLDCQSKPDGASQ